MYKSDRQLMNNMIFWYELENNSKNVRVPMTKPINKGINCSKKTIFADAEIETDKFCNQNNLPPKCHIPPGRYRAIFVRKNI